MTREQNWTAAQRLRRAHDAGELVAASELTDVPGDLATAYRCQEEIRRAELAEGARHRGWKIGLTSAAAQQEKSVDHPVAGFLLEHLVPADTDRLRRARQPRAELEVAFELARDLPAAATPDQVRAALATSWLAFEIVDSRWQGGAADAPMLVADNVSHAAVVLGPELDGDADLSRLRADLACGDRTSSGGSAEVFGDPVLAVAWLAAELGRRGHTLRAGDLVMSGTLCPPVAIRPGDTVAGEVDGLARLTLEYPG